MLKFYYNPAYKYTNRTIIDVSSDTDYTSHDYENIDSPDTINGHIIYTLGQNETIPTYIVDDVSGWRWFVSGITQLRTGKFQISLLRDIISENPTTWKSERAYITAGTASNYNKYKLWNLPYTNTKINQERLDFAGKSSFFVFYVNEQHEASSVITEDNLQIKYTSIPGIVGYDYEVDDLTEIPGYSFLDAGNINHWTDNKCGIQTIMQKLQVGNYPTNYYVEYNNGNLTIEEGTNVPGTISINTYYNGGVSANINNCKTDLTTALANYLSTTQATYGTSITTLQKNALDAYVDKVIYNTDDNKFYRVRRETTLDVINNYTTSNTLKSAIRNISFPTPGTPITETTLQNWIVFNSTREIVSYTLEELGTASSFDFNFRADVRKLPKSAVRCVNIVSDDNHIDEEIAQCLMLAQTNGINPDNTTGRILDIQYLPFSIASTAGTDFKIGNDYLISQFLDLDDYVYSTNLSDLSNINKETDTIKIVSPSRASQYLFRPYDNDGNMEFQTKVTLRPYTSTIYVRPSTKGLLLYDWDDKDCLIIQEDFSLTNVTSEWTQYVYQNKTYNSVFERQIQGREFERSWERRVEQAQAKSDEWTARNISAQKAQTYTGNIPIISSIAGAIGSAFADKDYMNAARVDREYNEALYQEGLSLSRDLFEYQLENIKSQPLIPSKITTIDCKFLDGVYLEFYSTNETELAAIANFYFYNGNRIDDYGTFADYWGNFVRGKIIISLNYTQPEIDELNRRLSMGIFTGGIL